MIPLTTVNDRRYSELVAETAATGFGDLDHVSAQPRHAVFLCAMPCRASFYGWAWAGRPSGLPGAYVTGSPTSPCARPPHLAMGSGITAHVRGRSMKHHAPVRSERKQSQIQQIARLALRNAALANTYQDALDVTGAALRAVAELSAERNAVLSTQSEVRHG